MRNSENAFGFCEAGCPREVLSYADFEKSMPQYEKVSPDADGLTRLEQGKRYKVIPTEGTCELYCGLIGGEDNPEAVRIAFPFFKGVTTKQPFTFVWSKLFAEGMYVYFNATFCGLPYEEVVLHKWNGYGAGSYLWTNGTVYILKENIGVVLGAKDTNLPAVTAEDNGKTLTVVRGNWTQYK